MNLLELQARHTSPTVQLAVESCLAVSVICKRLPESQASVAA